MQRREADDQETRREKREETMRHSRDGHAGTQQDRGGEGDRSRKGAHVLCITLSCTGWLDYLLSMAEVRRHVRDLEVIWIWM